MQLKDLDLNLLVVFAAVLRRKSATLAGEDLGMTQSAISNALRRLRGHFGDPLFVKTPNGMAPTVFAERLAGPLLEGLAQIQAGVDAVEQFDPARSTRRFCLYTSDVGQLILMPRLLGVLERDAPHVSVSVVDVLPSLAEQMMVDGRIDLAIGTFARLQAGFHRQSLFTKTYVAIGRRGHPAFRDGLTLDRFLRARHATYQPPAASHDDFEEVVAEVFRQHGARRRVVVELGHGLGIAEAISGGDLVACIPRRLAAALVAAGKVDQAELPFDAPAVEVHQFWHERLHADEGHRWFRGLVYRAYSAL